MRGTKVPLRPLLYKYFAMVQRDCKALAYRASLLFIAEPKYNLAPPLEKVVFAPLFKKVELIFCYFLNLTIYKTNEDSCFRFR